VIIKLSKLPIFFQNKKKMTSELAFQHIKGNYWYAAYGEFKVIMDKTNGYINATKMCTSGGKELCDWIKTSPVKSSSRP
jgi:KilA-N domain